MHIPVVAFALAAAAFAQPTARTVISPEVHSDRRVTFRFRAPSAREVLLNREGGARAAMQKDANGVWSITTDPLPPDIYGYSFVADGVTLIDPLNPVMKPNLLNTTSAVQVPGGNPWDTADVPRGTVHRHFYRSKIVGDDRDYYVYTPAGYNPKAGRRYPVLYLLHGYSDDASGWTAVGRAHVILDNLIAARKAEPMLIVMTLGYGVPEYVARGSARTPGMRQSSFDRFRDALFQEVIPAVEREYRAAPDRAKRAIAGLSMGGAESLYIGLNAPERFAWIGAFSSGGLGDDMAAQFPKADASLNSRLKLFWISCGTEDKLIESNRKTVAYLKSKGVNVELREQPGAHTWMVWRRDLAALAPLLFHK